MKVNSRKILRYICLFFIFLYPFNSTISSKIYGSNALLYLSILIPMAILFILNIKRKVPKKLMVTLIVTLIIVFVELINNHYFSNGNRSKPIIFTIYLFLPFVLQLNKENFRISYKVIKLFGFEHIFGTYSAVIFKSFYESKVLPFLDSLHLDVLSSSQYYSGVNTGFTTHYSTNGMYLSIITILLFTEFLNKKSAKNTILMILSLMALFIIGKRGHAIFTIIACLLEYLFLNREKISKKILSITIFLILTTITIQVVSSSVPQVLTVLNRINVTSNQNLLSGREKFYDLAIKLWDNHKILGNGWGAFSSYYQMNLVNTFRFSYLDAHNVYLQLLCETGIIGLILFLILFAYFVATAYKECKNTKKVSNERKILYFSFAYQIFFLLYCLTGNPLYDAQCYVIYFTCIGCTLSYLNLLGGTEGEKKNNDNNISKCI